MTVKVAGPEGARMLIAYIMTYYVGPLKSYFLEYGLLFKKGEKGDK